jgi:hypothetical protein
LVILRNALAQLVAESFGAAFKASALFAFVSGNRHGRSGASGTASLAGGGAADDRDGEGDMNDDPPVTYCPPGAFTPEDQIGWKRRPQHQPKATPTLSRSERLLKPTGERIYTAEPRRCIQCNAEYVPRGHGQKFCNPDCLTANREGTREATGAWLRSHMRA